MKTYIPKKEGNLFSSVQGHLYDTLFKNKELSKDLKIFNQVPKDTPYPYIYIGGFSVINRSTKDNSRMYFVNGIHIYSQDNSVEEILNWSNEIKYSMKQENIFLEDCHIVETDFLQMSLEIMPDSRIHRVVSKFRIIVEELDGSVQRKSSAA
jgi:hypothetical protein